MSIVARPEEPGRPDSRSRAWYGWRRLGSWWRLQWVPLAGPEATRGARWGILVLLTLFVAIRLALLPSGHGLWREGRIPTRRGDRGYNGVFLGWYQSEGRVPAVYSLALPEQASRTWRLTARSTVELSVAALEQNAPAPPGIRARPAGGTVERAAPDFTIELVADDGTSVAAPLSRFGEIQPPLQAKFTKFGFVDRDRYGRDWEPVLQTIRVPLVTFGGAHGAAFDSARVVSIRLKFDRTPASVICISGIGFGSQ